MSEWISINDELPEGDCLVYLEPDGHGTARMHTASYHPNLTTIGNHFSFDMPKVTHWRPLPPCPTTKD